MTSAGTPCDCRAGQALQRAPRIQLRLDIEAREEHRRKQRQERLQRFTASIPAKYRNYTLGGFKEFVGDAPAKLDAIQATEWYIQQGHLPTPKGNRHSVFFHGSYGAGKTTLAIEIAKARQRAGYGVMVTTWQGLWSRMTSAFKQNEDGERLIIEAMQVQCLILDDLADGQVVGQVPDNQRKRVKELLNHRTNEALPTIITSNLSINQLRQQFGEAVSGRIFEDFAVIHMAGEDLRQRGK